MAFLRGVSEGRNVIHLDAIFLKEGLVTGQIHEILMCNMHHDIKKDKEKQRISFRGVYKGGGLLGDTRDQQEGVLT